MAQQLGFATMPRRWFAALTVGLMLGGAPVPGAAQSVAEIIFTGIERALITDYYGRLGLPGGSSAGSGLPPGLQRQLERNGRLPAGLERQLYRNGTLPPGLQTQALPYDLAGQLPRRDDRFEILRIDNDVLLVERATRLILDIIRLGS